MRRDSEFIKTELSCDLLLARRRRSPQCNFLNFESHHFMKSIFIIVIALLLSACDRVGGAVEAGNKMNAALQKCVDHMKAQQGNTGIPECNSMEWQAVYLKAKDSVKEPSAELDAIDQKSMQLRQEAAGLMQNTGK